MLWWVVAAYLTRWRIEEAIRYTKQSYDLEDIRVLTYERLRNLVTLINAVAFFTAVELGTRIKLDILATHLVTAARRLFGVPNFRLYALSDGIRSICVRAPRHLPFRSPANDSSCYALPEFFGKVPISKNSLTL